jgi:hypothetical protein
MCVSYLVAEGNVGSFRFRWREERRVSDTPRAGEASKLRLSVTLARHMSGTELEPFVSVLVEDNFRPSGQGASGCAETNAF